MNKLTLNDEKELIEQCKQDIKAFSKLYEAFIKEVYRYVYGVVQSKEKAEDIVSQVFLLAIEKVKKFEWRGISIKYWFFKIARNLIHESFKEKEEISMKDEAEFENVDEIKVEDQVVEEEVKGKLKQLVEKLDELTREVIVLRIWEEMKFAEIGSFLEMKEVSVRSRYSRGVVKLQRLYNEDRKKDKKLVAVSIIGILGGLKAMMKMPSVTPEKAFINNLASEISSKSSLFIKSSMMKNKIVSEAAKTSVKSAITAKKVLLIGGITGLVVIGGAVGGYFIVKNLEEEPEVQEEVTQEMEDPYEGWETYENEEYGFSFRYPDDWKVEEDELMIGGQEGAELYSKVNLKITSPDEIVYSMVLNPDAGFLTLTSDEIEQDEIAINELDVTRDMIDIEIADLVVEMYYTRIEDNFHYYEVDGLSFEIYCEEDFAGKDTIISEQSVFEKMLTSLTVTDPYEGWKTYEYNYQIVSLNDVDLGSQTLRLRYPKDWKIEEVNQPYALKLEVSDSEGNTLNLLPIYDDGMSCVYEGGSYYEEMKDSPLTFGFEEGDFETVKNSEVEYLRGVEGSSGDKEIIRVCTRVVGETPEFVVFNPSYKLEIYYSLSKSYSEETLDNMDKILLSMDLIDPYEGWETYEGEIDSKSVSFYYPSDFDVTLENDVITVESNDGETSIQISGACDGCTIYPSGPNYSTFISEHEIETSTIMVNGNECEKELFILKETGEYDGYEISCTTPDELHIWGTCGESEDSVTTCDLIVKSFSFGS